jgi:biopolymer transport protein ExbB/TolQ
MQFATIIDYILYAMISATVATAILKSLNTLATWVWLHKHKDEPLSAETARKLTDSAEFGLTALFVSAQIAPFVGLTGTVLRIQEALVGLSGSSGIADIAHPVGAALHSTVLGLACAIPAVAAYGLLRRAAVRIGKRVAVANMEV